ncbi:MAG: pyruvate dehydrogenase (acetyl-transferring), homodimeric type, partial [Bacteroidota bacterium]|nr:pyruvate dehydrogenase (acetyl-transferring), homodimeric type [Bacteroidota bacterium]
KDVATTMVMVQILSKLLKDKNVGKLIVPIVPDESRTFGMDALFRQVGIYSHQGQLYEPVDRDSLMYYKEAKNGAILEEGINEAGSMSSFIAAGTSHSTHGVNNIPFFIFYSMFGFQRIGDLIWAAADARAKGFMIGGTSGRTTLAGEGLQHQDGNSHLLAMTYPSIRAYDPAFAFELSIIVEEGIREMYAEGKDVLYYITVMNEKYHMPAKPPCTKEHVLKGMYQYRYHDDNQYNVNLMGSGSILNQVILAADMLEKEFGIGAHIWSVTSYKALYDDVREIDRYNNLNPDKKKTSHLRFLVGDNPGLYIAATDYVKALPLSIAKYFPGEFAVLGTDGFGLSEGRESLRDHFEVDAKHIAWTTLVNLVDTGKLDKSVLINARKKLKINPDKADPATI